MLKLRTGRGVWHAEGIGRDELEEGKEGTEMRGLLFRQRGAQAKRVEPNAQLLQPDDVPVRQDGDAIVRVLVGEGSPVELGTPGLILDVELPRGGGFSSPTPADFNAFVYLLEGEASFGVTRRRATVRKSRFWTGCCARRGGSQPGDALRTHGREALRRDANLQRAVRGLAARRHAKPWRLTIRGDVNETRAASGRCRAGRRCRPRKPRTR